MGCVKKREAMIPSNLDTIKKNHDLPTEKTVRTTNVRFGRGDILVYAVL